MTRHRRVAALVLLGALTAAIAAAPSCTDDERAVPQPATTAATVAGADVAAFNDDVRAAVVHALAFASGVHLIVRDLRAGSLGASEVRARSAAFAPQLGDAMEALAAVDAPSGLEDALRLQQHGLELYALANRVLGRVEVDDADGWGAAALRLKLIGDHVVDRGRVATSIAAGADAGLDTPPVPDFAAEGAAPAGIGRPADERRRDVGAWRAEVDALGGAVADARNRPAAELTRAAAAVAARFDDAALTEAARVLRLALLVASEAAALEARDEPGPAASDDLAVELVRVAVRLWSTAAPVAGIGRAPRPTS